MTSKNRKLHVVPEPVQRAELEAAATAIWVAAEIAEIRQRQKLAAMEQEAMVKIGPAQVELQRLEQVRVTARQAMSALLPVRRKAPR